MNVDENIIKLMHWCIIIPEPINPGQYLFLKMIISHANRNYVPMQFSCISTSRHVYIEFMSL